jgi:hypothetical protein
MGNTEEQKTTQIIGMKECGTAGDKRFDYNTGEGHSAPHDGEYKSAVANGHPVTSAVVEAEGAIGSEYEKRLRNNGKKARFTLDRTAYTPGAPIVHYMAYHTRRISAAAVLMDAQSLNEDTATRNMASTAGTTYKGGGPHKKTTNQRFHPYYTNKKTNPKATQPTHAQPKPTNRQHNATHNLTTQTNHTVTQASNAAPNLNTTQHQHQQTKPANPQHNTAHGHTTQTNDTTTQTNNTAPI